jgi:hypothetical protein
MQSMQEMEKFYGHMKLVLVSMEACQLAMDVYIWVMDIMSLMDFTKILQVGLHFLPFAFEKFSFHSELFF